MDSSVRYFQAAGGNERAGRFCNKKLDGDHFSGFELVQVGLKDDARDIDRGEEVGQQTESEGDGEALDRPASEEEQNSRGDDGGDVSIDDGHPGVREALIDGGRGSLAGANLFADALKDEHVGIDAHTDGENDSCNAGQGERGLRKSHESEQDYQVEEQGQIGVDARALVVNEHEDHDDENADDGGGNALADGVGTQGLSLIHIYQLKQRNLTLDDLKHDIRRSLTSEKLLNKEIESKINITDGQIRDYYTAHKADFDLIEPQYRLARIAVTTAPAQQAGNLQNNKASGEADAKKKICLLYTSMCIRDSGKPSGNGLNVAFNGSYDFVAGQMQYAGAQAAYNWGCCGLTMGYRQFELGTIQGTGRDEHEWLYSFTLANFGAVGDIRRANSVFRDPALPPPY